MRLRVYVKLFCTEEQNVGFLKKKPSKLIFVVFREKMLFYKSGALYISIHQC